MINAETCALWPLYLIVFRPGFIGLVSSFIAAAFLTIVWTRSDPGPPPRRRREIRAHLA
jgi:hypothetical protein